MEREVTTTTTLYTVTYLRHTADTGSPSDSDVP